MSFHLSFFYCAQSHPAWIYSRLITFSLDSFSLFLIMLCPNHSDPENGLGCSETHCCSENKLPLQDCALHFERNLILPPASVERNHPEMILTGSNRDSVCVCYVGGSAKKKRSNLSGPSSLKNVFYHDWFKPADVQMPASQTTITVLCVQQWIATVNWHEWLLNVHQIPALLGIILVFWL